LNTETKKVAIVTAAGRGIGAQIARHLASTGYSVSLISPSGAAIELAQELGGVGMKGSVTSPADLQSLFDMTMGAYGRVDAVVNNTGNLPFGDVLVQSDDAWEDGFQMVLLNVIRLLRLVVPVFQKQGSGSVVNISSYGAVSPERNLAISSSLRAALRALTRLYAERLASGNIRVNAVLPGYVDSWDAPREIVDRIPMGRVATTQEVAKAVAFLLSNESSYITGQSLVIDGALVSGI
jgi:NAD(P)-dependent dehydrogenase (short-subunit alcohol dehydrogenase family)